MSANSRTSRRCSAVARRSTPTVRSKLRRTPLQQQSSPRLAKNIDNGSGIKYFHSNSTLADSLARGLNSVAIGGAAVASGKNAIALGPNSVADRDNAVSVGAGGSERQITNVAAGTASTDAANVGQLNAVSNSVISLGASALKYDNKADGTPDYANATLGNGTATGTGVYRDKAAIAIGFRKRFGTNMVLRVGGSTTGEETTGGAGFAFGF